MATSEHFSDAELRCKCGCGQNRMDPHFLFALESLRNAYGRPMRITSGYRCPAHNAAVSPMTGGSGPHTTGKAVDVAIDRGDAYDLIALAKLAGITGIGVKQHGKGRFLHLDALPDAPWRPRPTIWSYT